MQSILTINSGSSSLKCALFTGAAPRERGVSNPGERGSPSGRNLTSDDSSGPPPGRRPLAVPEHDMAAQAVVQWLEAQVEFASVVAVGHRVVHGMRHTAPELVTEELLNDLRRISPVDPEHLPREIELIEVFRRRHHSLPQVACFDTAFHRTLPRVATLLAIPRRYEAQGVRRYGFHGLSYAYQIEELQRLGDPAATAGRVILAHLGHGASMAAVRDGQCIDTSMGFTPTSGLPMGSRSGDVDPGLIGYLAQTEQMTPTQFHSMVTGESGLLGISETSSDMRELLAHEDTDVRAAEAVAFFCYQAKKWIGAFAAALGGVDSLVFAGGIGENAPLVRERICDGLECLGIALDRQRNATNAPLISTDAGRARVRVMRTDEERIIAQVVTQLLHLGPTRDT